MNETALSISHLRNKVLLNMGKVKGRPWPLASIGGFLTIIVYTSFTLVSWVFYPDAYGPITHYLSRLGNFSYNPLGAWFYNIGCVLTGVALIPFFFGLQKWHREHLAQRIIMAVGQFLGIASAIALMAIGVFSEDQGAPHMQASGIFFELNFAVLILISVGLLLHPKFREIFGLYGIAIDLSSLVLALTIGGPITEWYTVFGALAFVGIVSWNTRSAFVEQS
jgi:hypothetical membrane protein